MGILVHIVIIRKSARLKWAAQLKWAPLLKAQKLNERAPAWMSAPSYPERGAYLKFSSPEDEIGLKMNTLFQEINIPVY